MRRVLPLRRPKRAFSSRIHERFQSVERFPSKGGDLRIARSGWSLEGQECDVLDGLFGGRAYARRVLRASRLRLFRLWKLLEAGSEVEAPRVLLHGWPPLELVDPVTLAGRSAS